MIKREIKIGDKEVLLGASAALPMEYRGNWQRMVCRFTEIKQAEYHSC